MANLPVGTTIYEWVNSIETPSSVYTTSNSSGVNAGDSIYDIYGQELGTVQMMELSSPYFDMYTLIGSYSGYYERNMNDTTSTTVQQNINYVSSLSDGTNNYVIKDSEARTQLNNLATVATSGSYNDLSNKPTIPTVNNATLTITQGGTTKGTFTANASSNVTIDLDAGGGSSYTAGDGIDITNNVISVDGVQTNELTIDTTPTQSSSNLITSGGVYAVLGDVETLINAL